MVTISSGLRGTNGQPAAPPYNNGPYTWDENLTISGSAVFTGSTVQFTDQVMRMVVASTASTEWLVGNVTGTYTLAASLSAKTLVFPIQGLKTGDVINGYNAVGQIESAGNAVAFESQLVRITAGTADPTSTTTNSATLSATADRRIYDGVTGLTQTVAAADTWILVASATTGASTDVQFQGFEVTIDRK